MSNCVSQTEYYIIILKSLLLFQISLLSQIITLFPVYYVPGSSHHIFSYTHMFFNLNYEAIFGQIYIEGTPRQHVDARVFRVPFLLFIPGISRI